MTNKAKAETGCFESLKQTEVFSILYVTKSHHPLGGMDKYIYIYIFYFLCSSQCQIKHQSLLTETKTTLMISVDFVT